MKIEKTQIIWTGNEYELADYSNSEVPEWPAQDQGGHWHHEEFEGQRVSYRQSQVDFGIDVIEVAESDVPRDADGELNLNGLFLCNNGVVYRAV